MPDLLIGLVLGLVEGLTEFIPVSSTGHLILAGHLLGFTGERAAFFEIFIQMGAILAVVILYRDRFIGLLRLRQRAGFAGWRGIGLLAVTTLPAVILGVLARGAIKAYLFSPLTVAIGLAAGGAAILLLERRPREPRLETLDAITGREALAVGLFQCLAMWPGVSRAAATILGGMLAGLSRRAAAEYSFLAAVPALVGAALYDLIQSLGILTPADLPLLAVGTLMAFASAWLAVRTFLRLLGAGTLTPFGWYRLALAAVVLLVLA